MYLKIKDKFNLTTIKYKPIQSSEITDEGKLFTMRKEDVLNLKSIDEVEYHYKIELKSPINGRQIWYAFQPHVDIYDDETNQIIKDIEDIKDDNSRNLDIPYFAQTDNKIRPFQTCNMTSAAMVIEFYHPGNNARVSGQLEDALTKYCTQNLGGYNSIYYHSNIVKVLKHWGVKSKFSTTTPFTKIKQHLASGNPVIYSWL